MTTGLRRARLSEDNVVLVIDGLAALHGTVIDSVSESLEELRSHKEHGCSPFGGLYLRSLWEMAAR